MSERLTRRHHGVYIPASLPREQADVRLKSVSRLIVPRSSSAAFTPFHGNAEYMANEETVGLMKTIQHKTSNERRLTTASCHVLRNPRYSRYFFSIFSLIMADRFLWLLQASSLHNVSFSAVQIYRRKGNLKRLLFNQKRYYCRKRLCFNPIDN